MQNEAAMQQMMAQQQAMSPEMMAQM